MFGSVAASNVITVGPFAFIPVWLVTKTSFPVCGGPVSAPVELTQLLWLFWLLQLKFVRPREALLRKNCCETTEGV